MKYFCLLMLPSAIKRPIPCAGQCALLKFKYKNRSIIHELIPLININTYKNLNDGLSIVWWDEIKELLGNAKFCQVSRLQHNRMKRGSHLITLFSDDNESVTLCIGLSTDGTRINSSDTKFMRCAAGRCPNNHSDTLRERGGSLISARVSALNSTPSLVTEIVLEAGVFVIGKACIQRVFISSMNLKNFVIEVGCNGFVSRENLGVLPVDGNVTKNTAKKLAIFNVQYNVGASGSFGEKSCG